MILKLDFANFKGVFMTREKQKLMKELNKKITAELKVISKGYKLQFTHGFIYKFIGDFIYYAIININSTYSDDFSISILIKPWVLNETYWKVQKMNLDELSSQPKTIHFRGAFTINDIKYESFRTEYDKDNFVASLDNALKEVEKRFYNHQSILTNINVLLNEDQDYNVSNLCKAVICIYNEDFKKALFYLSDNNELAEIDVYIHHFNGKSAKECAIEYCNERIN